MTRPLGHFGDQIVLELAEGRLAKPGEDLRDLHAGAALDEFVRVHELKPELGRHQPAHGRLAHAHEARQRQVANFPWLAHAPWIPHCRDARTKFPRPPLHKAGGNRLRDNP